ncbi:DUF1330 domain-containing protein [Fulvivirgaceae bacterium BMA10]|uniref:DUF1330 domain-containing protein n=1 Tax=Splendidivirga corallicola TaxID=3051826 RepID=A0ABT8KVQ1_9BACT|nr:DUF1330 domain-containing protein [Fulvivirgaceae bacterium BMA10]
MIYITQLIFVKEGKENVFHEFEDFAIPLMEKYNGKIIYRLRPQKEAFISGNDEHPYEIHFISFDSENGLDRFMRDEGRKKFIHLKEASVKSILLIKGKKM